MRTTRRSESPWMRREVEVTAERRVLTTRSSRDSSACDWQEQAASISLARSCASGAADGSASPWR